MEEEHGEPFPTVVQNSLLFGLLGPGGHLQLAGSPVMETMHAAPLEVFSHIIAGHFQCFVSTGCDSLGLQHQKREGTEMKGNRPELEVDLTKSHRQTLESDEQIQMDQLASSSEVSSDSSFPPWVPIITSSDAHSASRSRRGRGRVDARSNNCGQVGPSSGTVRGHSNQKPAQTEVLCGQKKQSPKVEKDVGVSRARSTAQSLVTPSAVPLFGTVQILN